MSEIEIKDLRGLEPVGRDRGQKALHAVPRRDLRHHRVGARGIGLFQRIGILRVRHGDHGHLVEPRVGAEALQEAQAEANKNMAQAQAEIRRAAAVALEQEMKAKVEEMQAKVVEAEAQVPLAMAEAFRSGNLGIMDYYRMKNIDSDTQMRSSIAEPPKGDGGPTTTRND